MRKILVPTDFSENSEKALEFALEIAKRYKATVSLLHAYHPPVIDPNLPADALMTLAEQTERLDAERLEEWERECRAKGTECQSKLVFGGASEVILNEIKAQHPLLVVMGRTGKGGWLDKLMGSVAAQVATNATCPVLVLPSQTHSEKIKKMLYATELERPEEHALGLAFNLAEHLGAELTIVKVNAPYEVNVFDDEAFMKDIKAVAGKNNYAFQLLEADSVVEGLQTYADKHETDLIVMATRKRDWLSGLINPSVSKKMVLAAHVPVLICHLEQLETLEV